MKKKHLCVLHSPLTYKKDPVDKRDYKFSSVLEQNLKAVSAIDHSPKLSPVKDQGHLGSCVGFAVTALKEWHEKTEHEDELKAGKKGNKKKYNLSESWLYWNSKRIDDWPGEEGTSIRYAMQVLQKIGIPAEKAWPYDDINIGNPKRWAKLIARWNTIESYWRIENLNELKTALKDSPVPIGVPCFLEFFYPDAMGVITYPRNVEQCYGGHAILACGYDDSTRLIKFKNSWGKNWGLNGYGYLPYDYISNFLWDAWTCKDHAVTKDMLKGTRTLI